MKWHLTITLTAATLVGLMWFGWHKIETPQSSTDEPVLYYTKGTIESFDGTPRGTFTLYRIRGFDGQPEALTKETGNTYLAAPLKKGSFQFERPHNYAPTAAAFDPQALPGGLRIGIPFQGPEVVINPPAIPNVIYPGSVVLSSDDRFFAQSAVVCTVQTVDEPCPTEFVVNVYDYQTGRITRFDKTILQNPEVGQFQALLHFMSPNRLLIDVEGLQERSGQYFYMADMETGKAELVYTNLNPDGTSKHSNNYQVIERLNESEVLAFEWNFETREPHAVVALHMQTMEERLIDQPETIPGEFPVTQNGFFFSPDYNQGLRYRNFNTHTTRTLVERGEPRAVSPDGRYVVTFEPYTESGGYGSGRLLWWDKKTGRNRVVYDQRFGNPVVTNINAPTNPTPPLNVGDAIYGFVGLEVNGIPALDNPIN